MAGPLPDQHAAILAQKLAHGQLVLLVGAGLSRQAIARDGSGRRLPLWKELAEQVAKTCHESLDSYGGNILDLFDAIALGQSRFMLEEATRSTLDDKDFDPSPAHQALAELPWAAVYTTNYDGLLGRILNADPVFEEEQYDRLQLPAGKRPRLFNVHGTLAKPHTLTREDYRGWEEKHPRAYRELEQIILNKTALFVGYSLSDPHLADGILPMVRKITTGREKRHYAWMWQTPLNQVQLLDRRDKIQVIPIERDEDWAAAFQQVQEALREVRCAAGAALAGAAPDAEAMRYDDPLLARIWYLVDAVNGPFHEECLHAIQQLAELRPVEKLVIASLNKAAGAESPDIRRASLKALAAIQPEGAVPAFAAALGDPENAVRTTAVDALVKIGPAAAEAVPALADALLRDTESAVRRQAAIALARIGPAAANAVPDLVAALDDPESAVRTTAVDALVKIGPASAEVVPALAAALDDPESTVRREAVRALAHIGRAGVPVLVASLEYHQRQDAWGDVVDALMTTGSVAVPAAIAALQDPNERIRWSGAHVVEKIGRAAAEAVPALAAALKDPSGKFVRMKAANALSSTGPAAVAAVPALTAALKDEADVRGNVACTLAVIGPDVAKAGLDQKVVLDLKAALEDAKRRGTRNAAEALKRIFGSPWRLHNP